jgi:hypothetical protein
VRKQLNQVTLKVPLYGFGSTTLTGLMPLRRNKTSLAH